MDVCGYTPTNTLANATFDMLKMDAVEDPLINVNKLATMDFEESYFLSAVEFVNECMNDYTTSKMVLYRKISESTTEGMVLESFSDFFTSVKNIIDKFLKFIKSLFERFLTTLNSLVNSDKYLNKHKKDLDNFKSTDNFTMKGYKYTFQDNIPSPSTGLEFSKELLSGLYASSDKGYLTVEDVKTAIANLNLDAEYDAFRATVIGRDGETISVSDFSEELFRVFRNDELDTEDIEVDASYVRQAKARFFDYSKTKSAVERQRKAVEDNYKKLEKQVKEISTVNGNLNPSAFIERLPDSTGANQVDSKSITTSGFLSAEFMTQVDIYVKSKVDQIQEYSNIHALAYSAKLDAIKESYKQDKATLYTALSKIQRTDNARKEA
jgi:hypothetical protein